VERRLNELGDAVPVHEKGRAEMLVTDSRQAIKDDAPLDRLRSLTSELQQVYQSLGAGSGPAAGGANGGSSSRGDSSGSQDDDDVIDAEFTTG
jgi:molecular chaperone DnaK